MILPWRNVFIVGSQVVGRSAEVVQPSWRSKAQDGRETCAFCFSFCRRTAAGRGRPQMQDKGGDHRKIIALTCSRDPPERPQIDGKSLWGAPGVLRGVPGPPRDAAGTIGGAPGTLPGRPGTPQDAPGGAPERSRETPDRPKTLPRHLRGASETRLCIAKRLWTCARIDF